MLFSSATSFKTGGMDFNISKPPHAKKTVRKPRAGDQPYFGTIAAKDANNGTDSRYPSPSKKEITTA